jgi:hypothetical protein
MTTDSNDQPAPPAVPPAQPGPGGFQEGIYLEQKKGNIGTGSTAKAAEYRTFWATGSLKADSVVMVLLDDGFKPTAIRETFTLEALTGPDWFYIAEGEKKYQLLRPLLDKMMAAPPKPAAPQAQPAAPQAANWWGGGVPEGPAANPFELNKDKKQQPAPPKKGGWWEK